MKPIKIKKKQYQAFIYYTEGAENYNSLDYGFEFVNFKYGYCNNLIINNDVKFYNELINALQIAMDNKDCNCCNNSRDFLNMNNCKNYAWEYKALKSLLYKISFK